MHGRAVCGLLGHDAGLCIARIAALQIGPLMRDALASSNARPVGRYCSIAPSDGGVAPCRCGVTAGDGGGAPCLSTVGLGTVGLGTVASECDRRIARCRAA